ncbi:uncharacterized protein [Periplaneta americana]|uniref:uncharacterized protein isoform X2 n=1 Tax=Periplaneta americana TaxID=6978 RepID=UPI0037E85D20
MEVGTRISQSWPLLALCLRVTTTHLIAAAIPAPPPHAAVPFHSVPVKLIPHPLPAGGAILAPGPVIGPIGAGAFVAAPINVHHHPPHLLAHHVVPYAAAHGVPVAVPLKIFFTRFPPFIEAIVQRIQNYYSTYNHLGNEEFPASPPQHQPPETTTTTTPATTTQTTTTTTTTPAPTGDSGDVSNGAPQGQVFGEPEGGYRYDPPVSNPFRYPKPGFKMFTERDAYYPRS